MQSWCRCFEWIISQRNLIVGRWNKIGVNKMVFIHGAFKRELLNAVSLKNLFSSSVAYWKLHFPSLGQVWTQLQRGVTCWSILLQGTTASTSTSTSCLFPHFELLVRSSISTKVFAHFKRAALPRDEGKLVWFSEIRSFKKNLWIFSLEGKGIPSSWNILLQDKKDGTESV